MLKIKNLHAKRAGKEILKGIDLNIQTGETHVIMGPNGSGKSTLANAIMGNPNLKITGSITLDSKELLSLDVSGRANKGLFMAFQYPLEVEGVPVISFLKLAYEKRFNTKITLGNFLKILNEKANTLNVKEELIGRYLNEGFSGGEKKKLEILQLAILKPKYCILDETDSGLDISALKDVAEGINILNKELKMGILIITHYSRILKYIKPDFVHILKEGLIQETGEISLVEKLENTGYESSH